MAKQLLVPIDIHFRPRATLATAAELAREHDAVVTLLYVSDVTHEFVPVPLTTIAEDEIDRYEAEIAEFLGDCALVVAGYGVKVTTHITDGSPISSVIVTFARSLHADTIVMGTHGRRGLAHAWWGSITEEVIRESSIPVVVVNERQ